MHLAARSITGEAELHSLLLQLREAGVSELFLVAADRRTQAGPYNWRGELLEAVNANSTDFSIGIAGYPEGHPELSQEQLSGSLLTKAPLASSMVTQMCFSAEAISRYLRTIRKGGIELPVWVGVPGPGLHQEAGLPGSAPRGGPLPQARPRVGDGGCPLAAGRLHELRRRTPDPRGPPGVGGRSPLCRFHVYTFNDFGRMLGLLDDLRTLQPTTTLAPGSTSIPFLPAKI